MVTHTHTGSTLLVGYLKISLLWSVISSSGAFTAKEAYVAQLVSLTGTHVCSCGHQEGVGEIAKHQLSVAKDVLSMSNVRHFAFGGFLKLRNLDSVWDAVEA